MAAKIRSVDFLPEIFQTPVNNQFLSATLDQLIQEPQYKQTQGFIGQKVGAGVNPNDGYVNELTSIRTNYQLEPGVISVDPVTNKIDDAITYPGMLFALKTQGGITDQADRLFESEYYSWDPFVDFDKYNNYAQYYWMPNGPDLVTVAPTSIPTEETFTVTRSNGSYTFTDYAGTNPALTLVRNGRYKFVVAQNTPATIEYRVTNNGTSSWTINSTANPTLTLIRGNTYVFNLVQTASYAFYIKTQPSFGTTNVWSDGVTNNGVGQGLVTFTVPQNAPNTLYYCNDLEFNLRGQFNVVSAEPGTGPDFWIQSAPGVDGTLPWSKNISSRDVLGVSNNGTDLGTVTFNVPDISAQNFYYSMPYIGYPTATTGVVDLICGNIQFDEINGITVEQFLSTYPSGIDGITNLNGRTLVFPTQSSDPAPGGWYIKTPFDPIVRTVPNRYSTSLGYDLGLTISNATGTGSIVTVDFDFTTSYPSPAFTVGSTITVEGITPSGYNGTYVVTGSSANSVSYSNTTTSAYISGGTVNPGFDNLSYGSIIDPIVGVSDPLDGRDGTFDSIPFDQAIPITDPAIQASVWQIQYVTKGGVDFIQLNSIWPVANLTQFSVSFGTQYVNTQWYKNSSGFFTQMPLLTAALPQLYYQDSEDPTIFGVINLIQGNINPDIPALAISGLNTTGTTVTLSFAEQLSAPYSIGSTIIVSEITPTGYNGDYTVLDCTTTTVTYASTYTAAYTSGGVINSVSINSYINVDTDILGQKNYTSPNGVTFTNGLKIVLKGNVYPTSYVNNTYYVQGVGAGITLVPESALIVVEPYSSGVNNQPLVPDYITINMASLDLNPWTRSNRWFHVDVIDAAAAYNDVIPSYNGLQRANRPILEFRSGTKLFNFGTEGVPAVNVIDFTQTNALLNVNGQIGYGVNGYNFEQGSLVIFAADNNPDVRDQIYTVNFIVPNPEISTVPIIDLVPTSYSPVLPDQTTICINGLTLPIVSASGTGDAVTLNFVPRTTIPYTPGQSITVSGIVPISYNGNYIVIACSTTTVTFASNITATYISGGTIGVQGQSFYYTGATWVASQQKTSVNQAPLFDVFDSNGYSFGDSTIYPSSNFTGCKLLSYTENPDNPVDDVLGLPLAFFSINNIGDILFTNNLYTDKFIYTPSETTGVSVDVSSGFVYQYADRVKFTAEIGWQTAAIPSLARQQFQFTYDGQPLQLDILVDTTLNVPSSQVFINNVYQLPSTYTLSVNNTTNVSTITLNGTGYVIGDIIEVLVYSKQASTVGFYEIPVNLENNPFNGNSKQFSLGTVRQHYATICENLNDLQGNINGRNNTRDLGNIVPYGQLILQQSSPLTLAGFFLRNINYDLFASLEYNSREYIKYKNKLLTEVTRLDLNGSETISQILDLSISNITQSLTSSNSFYWSDMLPVGTNYTTTTTVVNPITSQIFNTNQVYDFKFSNYLGLLVYVNNLLLIRGIEYTVSTDAAKLTILIPLNIGDVVTINEYPTTVASWCPNTPSKMGLYPKYTPSIYVDDTYSEPTVVIQGHDGSITIAFGDIRDQVLFEFEKRIYDNIKVDDNPIPLTTDQVDPDFYPSKTTALLPGFFRTSPYSYQEINQIMNEDFLTWVGQNKVDYTTQDYIASNPFTYNYSQAANRIDQTPFFQGNWRGIYRYFYDTETPNSTPWEMVGFTEEPLWWITRYGPAPYTSGNTVLWDDLEAGIVGDPAGPYILPEYIRPGLTKIIPAGTEGELLPPTECIVGVNNPYGFQQSWAAGDGGPVQASWWNSSSYPFAIMRLMALTKPAQFFSLFADRDLYRYNTTFGQYLLNNRYRLDASGVQVYGDGVSKASYINWIVDYNQQLGVNSTKTLTEALANLDVRLCYRMASFSDRAYIKLYTERGGPNSTNANLEIPASSYELLFYKNQPFRQITYSSVIVQVEKLGTGGIGYSVYGYSNVQPYFEILQSSPVGSYQTISAGNITIRVPEQYTDNIKQIPYGYVFTSPNSVCDFLLGYGAYLESQGLIFTDVYNGYVLNWKQMAQEFLYFGAQGWQPNTMINLNPSATTITSGRPISIVDTIASVTPENMLLDQNRFALDVSKMIVNRIGNLFSVTTTNGQTINYLTLKFTNYEDMIVLNNVTQFNDLIYDPITASRQIRLSLIASTSTEWDGQLNAQGFILNLNNIKQWEKYKKYTKGDIVLYKNTYWQSLVISDPTDTFNFNNWVKSDYQAINNGLLPNLANKADQLVTTYNVYQANLTSDNDLFAFGLIGFRPRPYMTDMNLNDVTQVQLYQQFIGLKGTIKAAEIFNLSQLNKKESGDYNVYENWGILAGTYGAQANRSSFEIQLKQSLLSYNPSTIQIVEPGQKSNANQTVQLNDLWRESFNITSSNILPTIYETSTLSTALPSAGYVCLDDVDVTVFNIKDPSAIAEDISNIGIGTYIWIAKINTHDWGVYRVAGVPGNITQISNNLNGSSVISFNAYHGLSVADLIIIKYFNDAANGVYRVLSVPSPTTIIVAFSFNNSNVSTLTGNGLAFHLQSARVNQASDISKLSYVNSLIPGSKAWIDNDGNGHWKTVQKQYLFDTDSIIIPGFTASAQYGASVSQAETSIAALIGAPGYNSILTYFRGVTTDYQFNDSLSLGAIDTVNFGNMVSFGNSDWAFAGANASLSNMGYAATIYRNPNTNTFSITQLLVPPNQNFNPINFGTSGDISKDEQWMYVGAPSANIVYAYEKVSVEDQSVTYTSSNSVLTYNYADTIQINYLYPSQVSVTLDGTALIEGLEYTLDQTNVILSISPSPNLPLVISRNTFTQLAVQSYYNVSQNLTSGSGSGALFTVKNTRGTYSVTLLSGGQNYNIGDTIVIFGASLGGVTSSNNLTLTVTSVINANELFAFTFTGTGIYSNNSFALNTYLYNATTIEQFTVTVNQETQRPYFDYTFNSVTTELTFITLPPLGAIIIVTTPTYWQYVASITSPSSLSGDNFGASITTTTDGAQLYIGAPNANSNGVTDAGVVYVFDRSVIRYIVSTLSQMSYTVPGNINSPLAITVNGIFLLSTTQSINGQYSINGNIVEFVNITFNYGDIIEFGTNQFTQIQELVSSTQYNFAQYGKDIDACPLSCSLYAGAPFDGTYLDSAGSVDHQVNQSRVYGVITSTIANPLLTAGGSLRINNTIVTVPVSPNNTIVGFANAINDANIPNVMALPTTDLFFVGNGSTKTFNIGSLYTNTTSYTTVVYVNDTLQIVGTDYSYDPSTETINFLSPPLETSKITVVSGRLTLTVQNFNGGALHNLITVTPGVTFSVFDILGFNTLVFTQQILSPAPSIKAQFGASLSIDSNAINLIVGAPNGNVYEPTTFDAGRTYFDEHSTIFYNSIKNGGVAYTYDYFPSDTNNINNPGQFAFGQQIYNNVIESGNLFGTAVDYSNGRLIVGAPGGLPTNTTNLGYVVVYNNNNDSPTWATIREQQPVVDVRAINNVFSYNGTQQVGINDTLNGGYQTYFDFFDPLQGKILGVASRNVDYIGAVDPAQYNQGVVHNNGQQWGAEHLGQVWWDTDTIRFIDPNQDNIVYASRRWGTTFPGSKADVYQWIESSVPPSSYSGQGTPLSSVSYCIGSVLSSNNVFTTIYYFWVKGITTVDTGAGKTLSVAGISNYIIDPRSSGLPYIAGLNASTIAIYNAQSLLNANNTILSIGYDQQLNDDVVHQEYQIITDGVADSFLNSNLYRKFLDSLCGIDTVGNTVPDPRLSLGMRYGVQFRPRQSMFDDRFTALKNYLGRANTVLAQYPITEMCSFNLLNAAQPIPPANSGAWNFEVPNLEVLGYQNLAGIPVGYKYLVLNDSTQQGAWTVYTVVANQPLTMTQVQSYNTSLYWYYVNWYLPGYNPSIAPVAAVQNYGQLSTLTYAAVPVGSSVRVISNGSGKWEIYLRTGINPITDWQRVGLEDGTIAFKEELWNYKVGYYGFGAQTFDSQHFDQAPQVETRFILRALNEEIYVEELKLERNSSLILMFNYIYSEFTDPSWLIKTSYVDVSHKIRSLLPYQTYLADNQDFVLDYFQEVKPYHVQVRQFNLIYTGDDNFQGDITDFDLPAYWNSTLSFPQFVSPILTPYNEAITTHNSLASNAAPNAQVWLTPSLYSQWFNNYQMNVRGVTVINSGKGYTSVPVITFGTVWTANTPYVVGQQVYYDNNLYTVTVPGISGTTAPTIIAGSVLNGSATLTYSGYPATGTCIINTYGGIISITITNPGKGYITDATVNITGGGLPGITIPWSANLSVVSNSYIITPTNNIFRVTVSGILDGVVPVGQEDQINGTVPLIFVGQIAQAGVVMGNPAGHSLARTFNTTLKYDRYEYSSNIVEWVANTTYETGTQVRFDAVVWSANDTITSAAFDPIQWTKVDASVLSGVNRTMGYYVSTVNTPGLSLPLLIDGIDYPGVQVTGLNFDQDTGFDRGNFDINPFDNFSLDANGLPTYDLNILDTIFESSYLDPYLGTRPSDINIDGGKYVGVFESHAPEELVPGIEFDTLDFRVYTTPGADWSGKGHGFAQGVVQVIYDSTNPTISFANLVTYPFDLEITDATQRYNLVEGSDYTVDWPNLTFTMLLSSLRVNNGDQLGIYVYELGGGNQLFKNTYLGDEFGDILTVPVDYTLLLPDDNGFAIFVNGNYLSNANYTYVAGDAFGTTTITFDNTYTATDFISLVAIGPTTIDSVTTNYEWSVPLTQSFVVTTAGQLVFDLDPAFSLEYTNPVTAIVTVGGVVARGSAGIPYVGDGSTYTYVLPQRISVNSITIEKDNVSVYINGILQDTNTYELGESAGFSSDSSIDYYSSSLFDLTAGIVYVLLDTAPAVGAQIYIAVNTNKVDPDVAKDPAATQYIIDPNAMTLSFIENTGINPFVGQVISLTTFNDTREQRLSTQLFVGPVEEGSAVYEGYDTTGFGDIFDGTVGVVTQTNNFVLYQAYTDISRPWVSLNGRTLTAYLDYTIEGNQLILNSGTLSSPIDTVIVTNVTNSVVPAAMAFRIFQDMRGVQATYRITPKSTTTVTQQVSQNDDIIHVADAGSLSIPNFTANIWGVVTIDGERIMYREIDLLNNTISSLLRGTAGTAAAVHEVDAYVYDMGRGNLLSAQFQNYVESNSFLGNGTTTTYATDISVNYANYWENTEPYDSTTFDEGDVTGETLSFDYGFAGNQEAIQVYVGGELQLTGYSVTNIDPIVISFNVAPADGSEITILVKFGVTWYAKGVNPSSASDGVALQETDTIPALFLRGIN